MGIAWPLLLAKRIVSRPRPILENYPNSNVLYSGCFANAFTTAYDYIVFHSSTLF